MSYVLSNQGICHGFIPVTLPDNASFTLSYSIASKSWVFFHDYQPDMYVHLRDRLLTLKDNQVYEHNTGAPGVYYDNTPKPFFIDALFRADYELLLETVGWISEYMDGTGADQTHKTLTRISIWNAAQHSGPVDLPDTLKPDHTFEMRRTRGAWSFNDFRNILIARGPQFLDTLFHNYNLITSTADNSQPWHQKELMSDRWFCVRFEFNNVSGAKLLLHEATIQALKSIR